ncbi:Hsp20/alpha crystallin family protein [Niabella beijingensis]|uniref:Hsp20/alpha crystallin family protein n=1 Tax=Niabella beijingensis TaxID=2872700 RepID=UPI001CC0698E|nr:Hsp20/alpha crystallin family protein [Niabella beijingensis]MBZ4188737.1 Hsp20/alpha crystallin family protein [Niabella beijingensis]
MHTQEYRRPKYNVPINIEERDDCYRLTAFVPGFPEENIRTRIISDTLIITGSRDEEGGIVEFLKQEFPVRDFERSLHLNGLVDTACVNTRFSNGVLTIFLPKKQETTLRHIRQQLEAALPG